MIGAHIRRGVLLGALFASPLGAQTWAPPWPDLRGPEEPWHPDAHGPADSLEPWLAAGEPDDLWLAFVGTRHGARDVFLQRIHGAAGIVQGPLLRPHQDLGAFRHGNPVLGHGLAGASWVVWSDGRRGAGEDVLVRAYRGEAPVSREHPVSDLGAMPAARRATAVVALGADRALVGWREAGPQGERLLTRLLGASGEALFPERVLRTGVVRDLVVGRAGVSVFARAFWIEEASSRPALLSVSLDGEGAARGTPVVLREGVRGFDVAWDGEGWLVAVAAEANGRSSVQVERWEADLIARRTEPQRVARARGERIVLARHADGRLLLGSWDEGAEAGRPRLFRGELDDLRRWTPVRLPRDARGPLQLAALTTGFAIVWVEGVAPQRTLVAARLVGRGTGLAPWRPIPDPGAADQRTGALGRAPDGSVFCVVEAFADGVPRLWIGRGPGIPAAPLGPRRRAARLPAIGSAEDGRHLVAWCEERPERGTAAGRARWLTPDGFPTGAVLHLDRGPGSAGAGRTLPLVHPDAVWLARERRDGSLTRLVLEVRDRRARRVLATHELDARVAPDGLAAGAFLAHAHGAWVAWHAGPPGRERVYVRAIDATGAPRGVAVVANEGEGARRPRLAAGVAGGCAVAWEEGEAPSTDVRWRRFDGDLAPLGPAGPIGDDDGGEQDGVLLATDGRGGFVACWEDDVGGVDAIHLRTFDALGRSTSDVHRVHVDVGGVVPDRVEPRLLVADGSAWIAWMDRRRGYGFDVYVTEAHLPSAGKAAAGRGGDVTAWR